MDAVTYENLEPGVYLVKMKGGKKFQGEPEPGLITTDQTLVLSWGYYRLADLPGGLLANLIEWVQPLERQGGLSGAMYWGESIG